MMKEISGKLFHILGIFIFNIVRLLEDNVKKSKKEKSKKRECCRSGDSKRKKI